MNNDSIPLTIVGSRTTEQGLLVKFSDHQYYLFPASFLVESRSSRGDHIINPSQWLAENWKRH